jgi:hypothetical protein
MEGERDRKNVVDREVVIINCVVTEFFIAVTCQYLHQEYTEGMGGIIFKVSSMMVPCPKSYG